MTPTGYQRAPDVMLTEWADLVPIDQIRVNKRDRSDLGDITQLAASIAAIGLLHPVVVTAENELVAGERRLAALVELGWVKAPVTVVDLSTAEAVLRAEMDENTCRKDLTPYEASRARERRAAVLAPPAADRMKAGTKLSDSDEVGTKLVQGPAGRKTKNVAAIGTDYSGSTLDKVDKIRSIAEKGLILQGNDKSSASESVREVARAALVGLQQPGASVDGAYRKVTNAIKWEAEPDTADEVSPEEIPKPPAGRGSPRVGTKTYYNRSPLLNRDAAVQLVSSFTGFDMGMRDITGIDPTINADEAARWSAELLKVIRSLRRLATMLKEHGSEL